jgi:hypothetical protein
MKTCLGICCVVCGLLLCLSFNGRVHGQSSPLDSDPSLKLRFDFAEDFSSGRLLDVSGHGNDGGQFMPTNWITAADGVFGTRGARWIINDSIFEPPNTTIPVSQYIAVTNLNGIDNLTNGTLSFWAWPSASLGYYTFLFDAGYREIGGWCIYMQNIGWPFLKFQSYDGLSTSIDWPASPEVVQGFHLYTVTWDGVSDRLSTYFDGQLYDVRALLSSSLRVNAPTNWICIGAFRSGKPPEWNNGPGGWFAGFYEGLIRMYDRTLSAAEVKGLYHGWSPALDLQLEPAAGQLNICWAAQSNTLYQVEYRADLATGNWAPLGAPVFGRGRTNCLIEPVGGQTMRFYRVRPLP